MTRVGDEKTIYFFFLNLYALTHSSGNSPDTPAHLFRKSGIFSIEVVILLLKINILDDFLLLPK